MLTKTDLYFLTVVKTGSLKAAAEQLYVSQPSLSKYIQRIEAQLGTQLFDRSFSPMRLNECGSLYLQYLKDSVDREQQLIDQIGEIRQDIRGTLRIGIPSFCGQCYLPMILPQFSEEFPHVSLTLYEKTGMKIEQALLEQSIDLAIMHAPIMHNGFSLHPLVKERIFLVDRRNAEQSKVTCPEHILICEGHLSDIQGKPVIMPQSDQKLWKITTNFLDQMNYSPIVYTRTENIVTTLELAAMGMGIGFVPESGLNTVSPSILNKLVFYTFTGSLSDWQLTAVLRKSSIMNLFTARFIELIKTSAQRVFANRQTILP